MMMEVIDILEDTNDLNNLEKYLTEFELKAIENGHTNDKTIIQLIKLLISNLPIRKIKNEIHEHELKESYINPVFNLFFTAKNEFQFRSPEESLFERLFRTCSLKKPDAVVSTVTSFYYSFTRVIGEVKSENYVRDSVPVLYDKYRLALFGKDCVDAGVENVILYQAIGFKVYFYKFTMIEDTFYLASYLFEITVPSCIEEISSVIIQIKKLLKIKNFLKNNCILSIDNQKNTWTRDTLDTPIFQDLIRTSTSNLPITKKRKIVCDD